MCVGGEWVGMFFLGGGRYSSVLATKEYSDYSQQATHVLTYLPPHIYHSYLLDHRLGQVSRLQAAIRVAAAAGTQILSIGLCRRCRRRSLLACKGVMRV